MDNDEATVSVSEFRTQLKDITNGPCDTYEEIDDALRAFLAIVNTFHNENPSLDDRQIDYGCFELISSNLFVKHRDYVRRQFIYSLIEDDEYVSLELLTTFILLDGREDEETFVKMQDEGLFCRILDLTKTKSFHDTRVHTLLLELLAEMTRIKQLSRNDLKAIDDNFILYLFGLVEENSSDGSDPYHYPVIRVLLVLNEQFMCLTSTDNNQQNATAAARHSHAESLSTNRVLAVLSEQGPAYRTFGENLILLLNRESSLGPQLLLLKMLYLLFTTPSTFEYFYTNDLYVLVDVILRNLLDLDPGTGDEDEQSSDISAGMDPGGIGHRALRHTYLRVLFPLLRNTQLAREGTNYKRDELRRTLRLLASSSSQHFAPADGTVVSLVSRCRRIDWLRGEDDHDETLDEKHGIMDGFTGRSPPAMTDGDVAKRLLGMSNVEAGISSLSVMDVSAKVEKQEKLEKKRQAAPPAVPPPRRNSNMSVRAKSAASAATRIMLPGPPHVKDEGVRRVDAADGSGEEGAVELDGSRAGGETETKHNSRSRWRPVLPRPRRAIAIDKQKKQTDNKMVPASTDEDDEDDEWD